MIARQSTAKTIMVGPVLDADGAHVTGAVVGDFKISKNGGAPAALNGSATLTHRHTGHYSLALAAGDTDTVGTIQITLDKTTDACPEKDLDVIEEAIYDALYAASANAFAGAAGSTTLGAGAITATVIATGAIDADAIADNAIDAGALAADCITNAKIADNAIAVENIADNAITAAKVADGAIDAATFATTAGAFPALGIVDQGTAQAVTATTLTLHSGAAFGTNSLRGATLHIVSATNGTGERRAVVSNTNTAGAVELTVEAFTITPTGTVVYKLHASPPATAADIGAIADQVWEEALADHEGTAGSTAEALATAGGSGASAADIADAVWDEACSGHTTNGTYGKAFTGATSVFLASGISGTINTFDALDTAQDSQHATTQSAIADVPTVAEFEARTIVAANYATAANLATVAGYIDTEIGTIITHLTDIKGAGWTTTDTLEAIRDRGDAAWITATSVTVSDKTGFSLSGTQTFNNTGTWTGNVVGTVTTVTNLTNAPTSGDLTATMKASVNAEVVDVLSVDTFAELVADPGASPTIVKALMLLYMALRNKIDQTATTKEIHNNAGTVLLTKTTSDDGTTYSESKMA